MSLLPRILSGALLVVCALAIQASDWPQWRGPHRDGHVPPGERVPEKLPGEPKVIWRFKIGQGFASPLIANNRVFYFDNQQEQETLHAITAADGKEIWRARIDDTFRDAQGPPGPRCTPMVDGEQVYAQSCKGEFQCLDAQSGKQIWRTNFTNDFGAIFIGEKGKAAGATRHGNTASPIIDGEHVIAFAGATNGNSILCFEKRTGKVVWHSQSEHTAYSPPLIAEVAGKRQLLAFTTVSLLGLDPSDGKLLWRVPVNTSLGRNVTTPVVFEDMVCVASHEVGLLGVRVTPSAEGFSASAIWTNKAAAMNFSSPVAIGGTLYGLGPAKNIVAVNMRDGKLLWSKEGYFNSSADKAHAAFIVMGKRLLIETDGGELVLLDVASSEPKEISRVQVCGKTWCNPAYADGRLYLRDANELLCVQLAE